MTMRVNTFYVTDVRPWHKPRLKQEKEIMNALVVSKIPMGLNNLDIDCGKRLRIQAHIDDMTETPRPSVHLDASGDTILYSAGCTWLDIVGGNDRDFQWGQCHVNDDDSRTVEIMFDKAFARAPRVIVWINELDLSEKQNWRLVVHAESVTTTGFTMRVSPTSDTKMFGVGMCWIACPTNRSHITMGVFATTDPNTFHNDCSHSKVITFDKKFDRPPRVFIALSGFDIDYGANLRIKTHLNDVTNKGMMAKIDTWADTRFNSGIASYIAYQEF